MHESLEHLLRATDVPNPERADLLWADYRAGGPGAEAAFTTLLAWYGLAVYRRIWGFVRSDAAEDVFQDVLAKLHRERRKLATFEHALRWLRTVAVRECVDAHRRTARRKAREHRASRAEDDATTGHGEHQELQEVLAVALAKLSPVHREAVALVFFEGMDRQCAARVMGINRDTLAKRLGEALDRLRGLVPVPAAVAVGTVAGIEAALAARPRAPSAARLDTLTKGAWANAVAAGPRPGKVVVMLLGLAGVGGVTAAAWPGPAEEPAPTTCPTLAVAPDPPPAPVESVSDRNLRIFRAEVQPRQEAALKGLLLGAGGTVVLRSAEAHDVRVTCVYELRHAGRTGWVSAIRFEQNTWAALPSRPRPDPHTAVYFDLFNQGEWRWIDPHRPIILWRNPLTGVELVARVPVLHEAMAALDRLPQDDRTEAEIRAHAARMPRPRSSAPGTSAATGAVPPNSAWPTGW
jgi:RNA polymerase sigma factor (sigma-70 family)